MQNFSYLALKLLKGFEASMSYICCSKPRKILISQPTYKNSKILYKTFLALIY